MKTIERTKSIELRRFIEDTIVQDKCKEEEITTKHWYTLEKISVLLVICSTAPDQIIPTFKNNHNSTKLSQYYND